MAAELGCIRMILGAGNDTTYGEIPRGDAIAAILELLVVADRLTVPSSTESPVVDGAGEEKLIIRTEARRPLYHRWLYMATSLLLFCASHFDFKLTCARGKGEGEKLS